MTWVSVAIMVGTAVIGAEEQHQVAKRQDNALAAQLRQQYASEDAVNKRTQAMIKSQQAQTDQPQKTAAAQQYQQAIKANQVMANQPLAQAGNVSDAYRKSAQDAQLGIANFANDRGNTIAAIDAPGLQRQQNQRNIADFGIDVNQINRHQQSQDFLDPLKLNSIHANPWLNLGLSAANGYAKARMLNAGAGAGSGSVDLSGNIGLGGIDLSNDYASGGAGY